MFQHDSNLKPTKLVRLLHVIQRLFTYAAKMNFSDKTLQINIKQERHLIKVFRHDCVSQGSKKSQLQSTFLDYNQIKKAWNSFRWSDFLLQFLCISSLFFLHQKQNVIAQNEICMESALKVTKESMTRNVRHSASMFKIKHLQYLKS